MLSTPILYHGARVVRVFQLPRLDSQPAFQVPQEVQTPPAPAADQGPPGSNFLAASFLKLIQEHSQCPIVAPVTYCSSGHAACVYCTLSSAISLGVTKCVLCRSPNVVPGGCPFIYLRQTQDFVVSLMEGIAQEFQDTPRENPELRSYACGALRDDWKQRNRVGRLLIHDIQQLRGPLTPTEASRMVLLARLCLQGEGVGSAQLPIKID
ncbi:uncharacterized protein F5891DRAFT_997674 [Suillus fuscotomentosus]|uniref:Uncharacterized protein n=1 Tax=Suillus fuscotomentosus TaxID=1912939 RepID=A0AAD4EKR6_9AGAM|nr:uncharacterized protein F5891DRAFT_997674 [Suillus fuscotomentosus]KAG1907896.1 hypothetical protein F5891DRAFT_997674 [Suillus fuscotomentosus]